MVPDPGGLSIHRGNRRVGGLVIQEEISCRDRGFMGLSFDKHLTHIASSGALGVCQCFGQQSPEQDGEVQTREEKGAHRSESWTPCPSRTRNCLLAPIWHPGPGLPPCVEEETVQTSFTAVSGSGSPKTVTEIGPVVACSYRPLFSWKSRQSSQVGLTSLSSSARDPRALKTNETGPTFSRSQMEEMSRGWFALHTQSKGISALAVSAGCAERSAIFQVNQPITIFGSYFANITSETKSYFCPSGLL